MRKLVEIIDLEKAAVILDVPVEAVIELINDLKSTDGEYCVVDLENEVFLHLTPTTKDEFLTTIQNIGIINLATLATELSLNTSQVNLLLDKFLYDDLIEGNYFELEEERHLVLNSLTDRLLDIFKEQERIELKNLSETFNIEDTVLRGLLYAFVDQGRVTGYFDDQTGEFIIGEKIEKKIEEVERKEEVPLVFEEKREVATAREFDYVGGQVRFKVAVRNYTDLMIFNIMLNMDIPSEFQLVKISPKSSIQDITTGIAKINRLAPDETRGVDFYLEPLACGKGIVSGIVNYRDAKGGWNSTPLKPKEVPIKCPLIFTPEEANIAMIENLYNNLPHDFKRFALPFDAKVAAQHLHDTIRRFDMRHIRTVEVSTTPYEVESWFYTRAKVTNHQIAVINKISESKKVIDIWIACEDASELTGLLAKISEDFQERVLKETKIQLKYTFGKLKKLECEECGAVLPKLPTPTEVVECEHCKTVWTYQML